MYEKKCCGLWIFRMHEACRTLGGMLLLMLFMLIDRMHGSTMIVVGLTQKHIFRLRWCVRGVRFHRNFSRYRKSNVGRSRWLFFPIYFFILFLKCKWIHRRIGLYEDATVLRICMMAWQFRWSTQTWVDEFMMKILERRRDVFVARSKLWAQWEERRKKNWNSLWL